MAKLRDPLLDDLLRDEPLPQETPPASSPAMGGAGDDSLFSDLMRDEPGPSGVAAAGVSPSAPRPEMGWLERQGRRALSVPGVVPALKGLGAVGSVLDMPHRLRLRAPGHLLGEAYHGLFGPNETVPEMPVPGTRAHDIWQKMYGPESKQGTLSKVGDAFGRAWTDTAGGIPDAIGGSLDPRWARENPRGAWWLKYGAGIPLEIAGDMGLGIGATVSRAAGKGSRLAMRMRGLALPKFMRKALKATVSADDLARVGKRWARWNIEIPGTGGIVRAGKWIKASPPVARLRRLFKGSKGPLDGPLQAPFQAGEQASAEITYDVLREAEPALNAIDALKLSKADRFKASMAAELVKGADEGVDVLRYELDEVLKLARDPMKVRRAAHLLRGAHDSIEKARLAKGIPTPLLTRPIADRAAPLAAKAADKAAAAAARRGLRVGRGAGEAAQAVARPITTAKQAEQAFMGTGRYAPPVPPASAGPLGRFEAGVQLAGESGAKRGLQQRLGETVEEAVAKQGARRSALETAFAGKRAEADKLDVLLQRREGRLVQRLGKTRQRILDKQGAKYIKKPGAVAADVYEEGIDPAVRLERLMKALETGGEPLKAAKKDLFHALGKEQYAQALFEAKTISGMKQRLIRMRRAATGRAEKRGLAALTESFAEQEVRLAERTRAAADAIPQTLEASRGFQKLLNRARNLDEAFVTSPSYVARAVPSDLQDAMRQIRQDRVIPLKRAHGASAGVKERGFMDPATGRAYSMFELNRTLEKAARNPEFLKKNDYIRQLVEELHNEKTIPKLMRRMGEFINGETSPLVSRVLAADPVKSLALAGSRAAQDGMQRGFINALRGIGENAPDTLMRHPDWVPASSLGEAVSKRFGEGWHFPPEAKLEMQRIIGNAAKDGPMMQAYDKLLGFWKWSVTQPWPAFHFRNHYSDFVIMGSNGPFNLVTVMVDGTKAAWRKGKIDLGKKLGVIDAADMNRLGRAYGIVSGIGADTKSHRILNSIGRRVESVSGAGMTEESRRMGYFIDRLKSGLTPFEAALETKKVLFDYGAMSDFERKYLRRIIPFWAWMRNNIPLQVKTVLTKPYIAASQLRIRRLSQDKPPEWLPKWMRSTMSLVANDSGTVRVLSGIGLPVEDLLELVDTAGNPRGALREVVSDVKRGRLRMPLVQLGVAAVEELSGEGSDLVSAPKGSEHLPAAMQRLLGIREIKIKGGTQWVMSARGRRVIQQIRAVSEVTKIASADSAGEAALRSLTGLSQREYTPDEIKAGRLREEQGSRLDALPSRTFESRYLTRDAARTPLGRTFRRTERELRAIRKRTKKERRK